MSTPSPLNRIGSRLGVEPWSGAGVQRDVRHLVSLGTHGLHTMFDSNQQLFCHRVVDKGHLLLSEGISPRYTIMTLLGLSELESAGMNSGFNLQAIYSSLVSRSNWIRRVGDLGLLIWLTARFHPDQLQTTLSTLDCQGVLERYHDAQEGHTMELAWFLSGLAHAAEASPKLVIRLLDLAIDVYQRIEKNQGQFGFFGHLAAGKSLAGNLRGHIGSFADQVYPIYAFSKFAKVFAIEEPLGSALKCANAICRAQGELGQWWWLYDAGSGHISSRYPVYSVHQHGMAPMALFALDAVVGQRFTKFVYKGLNWVHGANEVGVTMEDATRGLIWRCVLPANWHAKYWEIIMNRLRPAAEGTRSSSLKILREQRPYEYGWLLFAFARNFSDKTIA